MLGRMGQAWTGHTMDTFLCYTGRMFGKKAKKEAPPVAPVNVEIQSAEQTYRREVAITEARPRLRRALLWLWTSIDIVLLAIFIGYLGFYLTVAAFTERRHVARIGENIDTQNAITVARSAQSLRVGTLQIFSLTGDTYDVYVEVENPNEEWVAEFTYFFERGETRTAPEHGFVLPLETRPLVAFSAEFDSRPTGAELVIEDLTWHRVDAHEITDIPIWMAEHNEFSVASASYALDHSVGTETIGRSTFTVTNQSAYSYYEAEFLVHIIRGNILVGVNKATLAGFESGESRDVTVNWFSGAPSGGEVQVIPEMNYFDESIYMAPSGTGETDIRDAF